MDGEDGYTSLWIYLTPLSRALKNGHSDECYVYLTNAHTQKYVFEKLDIPKCHPETSWFSKSRAQEYTF